MTEKEFLEKYGNEKLEFSNMYKFRVMYKNEELKIFCRGVVNYRDDIEKIETVNSIFDLDDFEFGMLS